MAATIPLEDGWRRIQREGLDRLKTILEEGLQEGFNNVQYMVRVASWFLAALHAGAHVPAPGREEC